MRGERVGPAIGAPSVHETVEARRTFKRGSVAGDPVRQVERLASSALGVQRERISLMASTRNGFVM